MQRFSLEAFCNSLFRYALVKHYKVNPRLNDVVLISVYEFFQIMHLSVWKHSIAADFFEAIGVFFDVEFNLTGIRIAIKRMNVYRPVFIREKFNYNSKILVKRWHF